MQKKLFDQHMHTSFSFDGEPGATVANMIESAIEKGLLGLAVTDHLDPLWPDEQDPSTIDLPAYEAALSEAESIYHGRIRFAKGIELGFIPGEALDICQSAVAGYPYDFVIGSTHSSSTTPFDYPEFHEGRSLKDIICEYYTVLLDSIRAYKDYDVLGHINYIDRFTGSYAPEKLYMPYIDEILRVAVGDGKGIEYNTSTWRFSMAQHGTPTLPILKRFRELGGEIITVGSDAHSIADVGAYIEKGEETLLAAGFRFVAVFKERRPEFVKL